MSDMEDIRLVLQRINDAWLKCPTDGIAAAMAGCFDDAMVVKGPGFETLARGAQACIQSYVDFVRQAKIRECALSDPEITVAGDAAVARYQWQMTYEIGGKESREAGDDLFVFTRRDGRWVAFWRAMLPR